MQAFLVALDGALGSFSLSATDRTRLYMMHSPGHQALEAGLGLIDALCKEAQLSLDDVEAFAVGIGPGGFTGLRITLSYAKAMAFATGKPLIGVSSYDIIAEQAALRAVPKDQLLVVRPRAGVFCARFIAHDEAAAGMNGTTFDLAGSAETIVAELRQRRGTKPLALASHPPEAADELLAAGLEAEVYQALPQAAAVTIAQIAQRRLDAGERFGSVHAVRAEYGEAPATTMRIAS